ncbi:bacterio-opsin activator domain-containing protein [Halospeciosus flavus]|uniref:Bacterio-opsin activator domain-containing protein n=1 Tax=Halospeciosus flavus TaxID=3032283 RepID=A0ABD5Z7U8_9EURY|nr:bacterio-opsin activator domain-containing protein [Halospeciosus flavus]
MADGGRDGLTSTEYERVCRATETYREELVVELCGRVGLRPSEIARLRPSALTRREFDGAEHYFLDVPDGDGGTRRAYVPVDVADAFQKYVEVNDTGDDERVFGVTPRRLQMLVSDVSDRADDGDARLADVSARDLRQYFARWHLVEEDVDPRVVQVAGGWSRLDSLEPYLDPPTDRELAAALGDEEAVDGDDDDANTRAVGNAFTEGTLALGSALESVSTREEVERATCETLGDLVRAAWVCDERGDLREWAGTDETRARETVEDTVRDTALFDERGVRGDVQFVECALDADRWDRGCTLAVSVARSNETAHGLLCVVGPDTPSTGLKQFLVDAGRRVGWTLDAVERKRLLLADTGVELSFEVTEGSFFVEASSALDCRFDLEGLVPVEDQSLLYFVTAEGASVEDLLDEAAASESIADVRLIRDYGERAQLEFVVSGPTPTTALVERGGAIESATAEDGVATITGVFSKKVDVRGVVEDLTAAFPGVDLRAKREVERSAPSTDLRQTLEEGLTEKQRSALRAAYFAGYFEWPRGSTAEELADAMDVSSPTLHNHLRKAQQKLLTAVFEE